MGDDRRSWARVVGLLVTLSLGLAVPGCGGDDGSGGAAGGAASASTVAPGTSETGASTASTSTTDAPTTTSTTTAPPAPQRVSLLFTGDVLVHEPVAEAARRPDGGFDFAPLFAPVRGLVEAADVAVCHLEIPLDDDDTELSGYPLFQAPRGVAEGLRATGFDGCSTASNHSLDRGREGVRTTLEALDAAGMAHAGTGRSPEEAGGPAVYRVGETAVAHLSYTYGTNGIPLPADAPWTVRLIDPEQVLADARGARALGADVVVVSLHWGVEYRAEPTSEQQAIAEVLRTSGEIDLIVGHHAHVVQPIDGTQGTWVVYGLGNFVSNQSDGCCSAASQDGAMVRVELLVPPEGRPAVERVVYTPLRVDRGGGYRVVPVAQALADPALAGTLGPEELRASFARSESVLAAIGHPALVPSARPPA